MALTLAAVGIYGVLGARSLSALLYGVPSSDPIALAAAAILLGAR